jgi:WD40 repeat protein
MEQAPAEPPVSFAGNSDASWMRAVHAAESADRGAAPLELSREDAPQTASNISNLVEVESATLIHAAVAVAAADRRAALPSPPEMENYCNEGFGHTHVEVSVPHVALQLAESPVSVGQAPSEANANALADLPAALADDGCGDAVQQYATLGVVRQFSSQTSFTHVALPHDKDVRPLARMGDAAVAYRAHGQQPDFAGSDLYAELSTSTGGDATSPEAWADFEMASRGHVCSLPLPQRLPQGLVSKLDGPSSAMAIRYDPTGRYLAVGFDLGDAAVLYSDSAHNSMRIPLNVEAHYDASAVNGSLDVAWHEQGHVLVRSGWSGTLAVSRLATQPGETPSTNLLHAHDLSDQLMGIFGVAMMGHTVVAAASRGLVFAADLETLQVIFHPNLHSLDVNTVCSVSSFNRVFATGGDDGVIVITDLRAHRPAACLGHSHSITSLDSRGDERYIVSNSKDQTAKIFDLRRATTEVADIAYTHSSPNSFVNYRAGPPLKATSAVDVDNSDRTFTGHSVHCSLLRSRFSPLDSTGGRYIACGAIDGKIPIFDILTGTSRHLTERRFSEIVRDVAWHPDGAHIAAACSDGAIRVYGPRGSTERREAQVYAMSVEISSHGHTAC